VVVPPFGLRPYRRLQSEAGTEDLARLFYILMLPALTFRPLHSANIGAFHPLMAAI